MRLYLNDFKNCVLKKKSNFEILLIEISGLASNSRVYTPLENSDDCILARKLKKKSFGKFKNSWVKVSKYYG